LLGAGLVISTIWLLITIHGWSLLQRHAEMANSFAMTHFRHLPNPFNQTGYHRSEIWIHLLTLTLIGVFVLVYLGLGYVRLASG
jgi:hypothetical protein